MRTLAKSSMQLLQTTALLVALCAGRYRSGTRSGDSRRSAYD